MADDIMELSYGGQDGNCRAVRNIAAKAKKGELDPAGAIGNHRGSVADQIYTRKWPDRGIDPPQRRNGASAIFFVAGFPMRR